MVVFRFCLDIFPEVMFTFSLSFLQLSSWYYIFFPLLTSEFSISSLLYSLLILQLCFDSVVEVFLIFDLTFGVYFFLPFFTFLLFELFSFMPSVLIYLVKKMGCTLYSPQKYLYNKLEVYIGTDLILGFYSFQN